MGESATKPLKPMTVTVLFPPDMDVGEDRMRWYMEDAIRGNWQRWATDSDPIRKMRGAIVTFPVARPTPDLPPDLGEATRDLSEFFEQEEFEGCRAELAWHVVLRALRSQSQGAAPDREAVARVMFAEIKADIRTSYAPDGDPKAYADLNPVSVHRAAGAVLSLLQGERT